MGHFLLVLGGQKSGKSSHAASRARATGQPVTVITPAAIRDDEFRARVARHRAERPGDWTTIETFALAEALSAADATAAVIIDALDTWLAETLLELGVELDDDAPSVSTSELAEAEVVLRLNELAGAAHARQGMTIVIAGQPGLGVHASGRGARAYVDLHGIATQALSRACHEVVLLVAGRPITLAAPDAAPGERSSTEAPLQSVSVPPVPDALRVHGDTQVPAGSVDLAVNVQPGPPDWLAAELAERVRDLASYPDDGDARAAAAARHGRLVDECAVVAGAAEAFWLLAHAATPRLAACIHPSFTEPEAALRTAGVPIVRVPRDPSSGWMFDPERVPDDADMVLIGRPDNPTGAVDDEEMIARLCRPGRLVVVDEAFTEFLADARGMAGHDVEGLVCVRSLTKLWGLASLRVGYLLGPASVISRLDAARQPWTVSTLALHALSRLVTAEEERRSQARGVAEDRKLLVDALRQIPDVTVWESPANFVLVHTPHRDLHGALLQRGLAVRRCDTFPGLDRHYIRIAVRSGLINEKIAIAIRDELRVFNAERTAEGRTPLSPPGVQ